MSTEQPCSLCQKKREQDFDDADFVLPHDDDKICASCCINLYVYHFVDYHLLDSGLTLWTVPIPERERFLVATSHLPTEEEKKIFELLANNELEKHYTKIPTNAAPDDRSHLFPPHIYSLDEDDVERKKRLLAAVPPDTIVSSHALYTKNKRHQPRSGNPKKICLQPPPPSEVRRRDYTNNTSV